MNLSSSFQSLDNRILCTELLEDAFGGADFKNNRAYQQMLFEEMSRVGMDTGMGSTGQHQVSLVEMNKRLMQFMTARIRCAISSSSSAVVPSSSAVVPSSSAVVPSSSAVVPSSSAVVPSSNNIHDDDDRDRPLENIDSLLEKKLLQRQEFGVPRTDVSSSSYTNPSSVHPSTKKKAFQIREDLNNVNIIDYDLNSDLDIHNVVVSNSNSNSNEIKKKIRLEDIMDVGPIPVVDSSLNNDLGGEHKKTLSEILNLMKSLQRDIGLIKQKLGLGNL